MTTVRFPRSSTPSATPLPAAASPPAPTQLISTPEQAHRAREPLEHPLGRRVHPAPSRSQTAASASSAPTPWPTETAGWRRSVGKLLRLDRHVEADPDHRPVGWLRLDQHPGELAAFDPDVVGPLDRGTRSAPATRPPRRRRAERRAEAGRARARAGPGSPSTGPPSRPGPSTPAAAAAARGLLAGGDDGAARRSADRELASALVGGVGDREVPARTAEAGHVTRRARGGPGRRPRGPAPRRRCPGSTPARGSGWSPRTGSGRRAARPRRCVANTARWRAAPASTVSARPSRKPVRGRWRSARSRATFPYRSTGPTRATTCPVSIAGSLGASSTRERDVDLLAGLGRAKRPGPGGRPRGRRCRDRGRSPRSAPAETATARRRPPPRRPPSRSSAGHRSPLSGPTSTRSSAATRTATARRAEPTSGSTTARCTPGGVKGSALASTAAPCATAWRGMPWVRSITFASGAIRAITARQTPANSSSYP